MTKTSLFLISLILSVHAYAEPGCTPTQEKACAGYGNDPRYWALTDPQVPADDMQNVCMNFQIGNAFTWINTLTTDRFILVDVKSPQYNAQGDLVNGVLVWAKYNLTVVPPGNVAPHARKHKKKHIAALELGKCVNDSCAA